MKSRLHCELGRTLKEQDARDEWVSLIRGIAEIVDAHDLQEEVLFHGTTLEKAMAILSDGMRPTDAFEVLADGSEVMTEGSYWGTIGTAAWYAEDSARHRSGGRPVIIACPTSFLETYTTLGVDIPSRDMPQPGLTLFDDPSIAARWATGLTRSWRDSLDDLGSVTALHEYDLPLDAAFLVEHPDQFKRILPTTSFST